MYGRKAVFGGVAGMLAILAGSPTAVAADKSVILKRVFVPGTVSYVESKTEVEQDISGLPMPPMKLRFEQLYGLWERVESITEDKTTISLTYDRAARSVEAPMVGAVEFDTDDPEYEEAAPQLGAILEPMIGMTMTMELGVGGEVLTFSGMDAINRKVSERAVASMHWEQMKDDFTDERGMETWGREPLLYYANKEVKVGDSWQGVSTISEPTVGTIVTDYRYKVDRIGKHAGREAAVISVSGAISTANNGDVEGSPAEQAPSADHPGEDSVVPVTKTPESKAVVTGVVSGSAVFDVQLGRIVERTTDGKIDMQIPLRKLMPNLPDGVEGGTVEFKMAFRTTNTVHTPEKRSAQKAAARQKAEMRRLAEADDDDDEGAAEH
jgi:hypothetical protein